MALTEKDVRCRDNSGTIDRGELDQALQSFGYPLPRDLVRKLEKRFGERCIASALITIPNPAETIAPSTQPHQKKAKDRFLEESHLIDS